MFTILLYNLNIKNYGVITKRFEQQFKYKKDAINCYNTLKNEIEKRNFWGLSDKYEQRENLIYLYRDKKVIKRMIIKKKERGSQK